MLKIYFLSFIEVYRNNKKQAKIYKNIKTKFFNIRNKIDYPCAIVFLIPNRKTYIAFTRTILHEIRNGLCEYDKFYSSLSCNCHIIIYYIVYPLFVSNIISLLIYFQVIPPDTFVESAYYNIYHHVSQWMKPSI